MPSLQDQVLVADGKCIVDKNVDDATASAVDTRNFALHPTDGALCSVSITTSAANLDPSLSGYGLGDLEIQLGEGDSSICDAIDAKLKAMKAGDTCQICLPKNTSSGSFTDTIPVSLSVSLKSFKSFPYIYEMTDDSKLEHARRQKSLGVELFKQGNVPYAFRCFSRALKYCIMMLPESQLEHNLRTECRNLRCQCYTNLAACQLKHKSYKFVIDNCSKALNIEPDNVKAFFRRAEAQFHLGQYSKAKEDAILGLRLEPKSRTLKALVERVEAKLSKP